MARVEGFYAEVVDPATSAYKYYASGEWKVSCSGKTVQILNPCTNQPCYDVQGKRLLLV
jgi:glyceraldehyde-3-phosphate dehydrogenase (NADP+)